MDFALSEEQDLLRKTVEAFVARHCPAEQAKVWDEEEVFPVGLWRAMADLDWFGLPYPVEWGGGGAGRWSWW